MGDSGRQKVDQSGKNVEEAFMQFLNRVTGDEVTPEVRKSYEDQLNDFFPHEAEEGKDPPPYPRSMLLVDFADLQDFDEPFARMIAENYYRYEPFLRNALQRVLTERRSGAGDREERQQVWVGFKQMRTKLKVRMLRADSLGGLVSVTGTVTRTSQVRPELMQGKFVCMDCGTVSDLVDQQFRYTEPLLCRNPPCQNRWHLKVEESRFTDWQKVKVQENADEIPSGSMPRTLDVILHNEAVERPRAGDRCVFTGMLVAVPEVGKLMSPAERREIRGEIREDNLQHSASNPVDGATGLKALGVRDLNYRLCFVASWVEPQRSEGEFLRRTGADDEHEQFADEEISRISEMKEGEQDLMTSLASSIAPHIYGHEKVKLGLLLMLFGGVHKMTPEGIPLRGDINVCIVGDPATSKSQFLKCVQRLVPRCVYTTGKSSTAVGLTASVVKDAETGEFGIEAGALMLADNGICCIDEFDKMAQSDQVAIHEAMEQQTISIAKAGIKATLNARACIVAAANPVEGRYRSDLPLKKNVNLSAAILSRFDLFFTVQDPARTEVDERLAIHVVELHQGTADLGVFSADDLRLYRRYARTKDPCLTDEAKDVLVRHYVRLRQRDKVDENTSYRVTTRQLESIVRLSEATARVFLSDEVTDQHVNIALDLMKQSFVRLEMGSTCFPPCVPASRLHATENMSFDLPDMEETQGGQTQGRIEFRRAKTMLLMRLGRPDAQNGMRQSDLRDWYLDQSSFGVDDADPEARQREALIVDNAIERMLDSELVVDGSREDVDSRVLLIHPNLPAD